MRQEHKENKKEGGQGGRGSGRIGIRKRGRALENRKDEKVMNVEGRT